MVLIIVAGMIIILIAFAIYLFIDYLLDKIKQSNSDLVTCLKQLNEIGDLYGKERKTKTTQTKTNHQR